MPLEEPPEDRLALCGTCWMFSGIFLLVLGMVLTALGYVEHHILAFRITGPCFIGASSIMLTAASACCVSAHRRGQPKHNRRTYRSASARHSSSNHHQVHSPSCPHYRPPPTPHSHPQDRHTRSQTIPRVEVVPPAPQRQPNINPLAGLTFVAPPRQQRRSTGVSDEEMSSDYDNVPKTRRGRHTRQNSQLSTFVEVDSLVNERSALISLEPGPSESQTLSVTLLSPVAEAEDTNIEPPPSYEDVMAHSP
ncbi:uncharacterized protein [Ptychodera flava]|uniref:uncharacterized protein n=1 Tax=Ptychodera flava TaxID=63121 RepID=UPI00396A2E88